MKRFLILLLFLACVMGHIPINSKAKLLFAAPQQNSKVIELGEPEEMSQKDRPLVPFTVKSADESTSASCDEQTTTAPIRNYCIKIMPAFESEELQHLLANLASLKKQLRSRHNHELLAKGRVLLERAREIRKSFDYPVLGRFRTDYGNRGTLDDIIKEYEEFLLRQDRGNP